MKKAYLFFCLLNCFFTYAQVAGGMADINGLPKNVPSPNAASLGQYGQIPVNYFNGLPNIDIPIFSEDQIDMSLSYHASGIRPENHPGWVGLGWTLKVGGAITRIVNGGVDEVHIPNFTDETVFSYYDHPDILDRSNWYNQTNMEEYYTNTHPVRAQGSVYIPYPSPDEFTFNFNGISGSFFYNHKGKWVVKSNQAIDIKVYETLSNFDLEEDLSFEPGLSESQTRQIKRIFYGFELVTSDGTKYIFGKTPNSIEFNSSTYKKDQFNTNYIATTWYLTKIISPKNREVIFEYIRQDKPVFTQSVGSTMSYWSIGSQSQRTSKPSVYSLKRMNLVYLNKIKFDKGEIIFNTSFSNQLEYEFQRLEESVPFSYDELLYEYLSAYDNEPHWKQLDNIIIKNKTGNRKYNIEFSYTNSASSRLFLNKITTYGTVDNDGQEYSFEYNSTPLPEYNSKKVDHWGYYNGVNFFDTNSPASGYYYDKSQVPAYSNSRSPNANLMQAGILKKIIFPTKGFTEFTYEPHEYSQVVLKNSQPIQTFGLEASSNTQVGGLRIQKIVSNANDVSSPPVVKEYFYVKDYKNNNFSSSGILAGKPLYLEEGPSIGGGVDYWTWHSYSIEPMSETNGNHVTYSNVVEKSSVNNGFTEYIYSNHDNALYRDIQHNSRIIYNTQQWKYMPFNKKGFERGKLLFERNYSSAKKLIREVKNNYSILQDPPDETIRALFIDSRKYGEPLYSGPFTTFVGAFAHSLSAFDIRKYFHFLSSTEEVIYDDAGNNPVSKIETFSYNNYRALKQHNFPSSNNNIIAKSYYPNDVSSIYSLGNSPITTAELNAINKLKHPDQNSQGLNRTHTPVQVEIYSDRNNDGVANSGELILTKRYNYSDLGNNIILPKNEESLKGIFNEINNKLEERITYHSYYENGNVKEISKKDGARIVYLWGYNEQYPVARIENATYSQVSSALGASNITLLKGSSLTASEVRSKIALLRNHSTMSGAQVMGYTHDPLVGVTSITDPRGDTVYYEYDDFNRLEFVKDAAGKIVSKNEYHYKN